MFGIKPHSLDALDLLPSDTVIAGFSDIDAIGIWNWISSELEKCGIPEVQHGLVKLIKSANNNGIDINKILSSIHDEIGIVVTMSKDRKTSVPLGLNNSVEIPEPAFMIAIKVKDNTIFDLIQSKTVIPGSKQLSLALRVDSEEEKSLIFKMGIPFLLGPVTIVQTNDCLFIGSNVKIISDALAVRSGKAKGLKNTTEFQSLTADIPLTGNGFKFINPRVSNIISEINKHEAIVQKMMSINNYGMGIFSVSSILKNGIIFKSKSTYNVSSVFFAQAVFARRYYGCNDASFNIQSKN